MTDLYFIDNLPDTLLKLSITVSAVTTEMTFIAENDVPTVAICGRSNDFHRRN